MNLRLGSLQDTEILNQLHFKLNSHRHRLQPKNFQQKSMGEEWVKDKIMHETTDYIILEINDQIKGMALVEVIETYSIPGSLRYKYLQIEDFIIDMELDLDVYGQALFNEIRTYGKKLRLNHIQLNELANDYDKIEFFYQQNLKATQKTLKCTI